MQAHRRPKEAHVVAALEAAAAAHGLGEVQPLVLHELEELGENPATGRKIVRPVVVDNTKAHRTSVHERHAFASAYMDGKVKGHRPAARGARGGEAHVVHGDSIAQGERLRVQLEAAKAKRASERESRVLELAAKLEAKDVDLAALARTAEPGELRDALVLLGVKPEGDAS